MLPPPDRPTVATHWGLYRARLEDGRAVALEPYEGDPDPSPMGQGMIEARTAPARIRAPAVRASVLEHGFLARRGRRGGEPFVEVDWTTALDLVAGELRRVREAHGNEAIYGGSYGWGSAGRFHHAQSQVHRFLNCIGGYTRSVQNYSFAAADTIWPYILGDRRGLLDGHTPWSLIAGHARLIVMFGGMPWRNGQVNAGGVGRHELKDGLSAARAAGARIVLVSPIRDDAMAELGAEWLAPRPNTDVALMLGLAHTLVEEGRHDEAFLERCTTGFDRFLAYLRGEADGVAKSADWAAGICDLPPDTIRALARAMSEHRTFVTMAWALQRADHGEQPCWMLVTLAAMLGQIGLPGGGFGFGYGSANGIGQASPLPGWPALPQGENPVESFIPVARIADMLLDPGGRFDFDGRARAYPDIRLVYWAGGNPFHHHQDLNRLVEAWQRPDAVIVHEMWWNALARHADIVLPATTPLERNDIACARLERFIAASHRLAEPAGAARDDFAIFADLAARLGVGEAFTEGRDEEAWLRHLYGIARQRVAALGHTLPEFDDFWREGVVMLPETEAPEPLLAAFRADPGANRLATPSGRIEIFSARIDAYGYVDCPGHPAWMPPGEWLGAERAATYRLHLISNQPRARLHSQYDHGPVSQAAKRNGREVVRINPADAAARGIADGDVVELLNDRGACLAVAEFSDDLRHGVLQLSTGAWYDPERPGGRDRHGNPNVLTRDAGTSRLAQGPSAQSCLVEIRRLNGEPPTVGCVTPQSVIKKLQHIRGAQCPRWHLIAR